MNSVQESKNELEAAIRYAENAISSAKQTIESMEFRQEMAKKNYQEQTGREQALEREVRELKDKVQGQYDDIALLERANLELVKQKEASSGPCGCQAYRDLEEARGRAEGEVELLQRTIADLESKVQGQYDDIVMLERDLTVKTSQAEAWKKKYYDFKEALVKAGDPRVVEGVSGVIMNKPTMPVIPKDVAIAIFREGTLFGVEAACDEIQGETINIEESEYVGDFHISFDRDIDLDDHIDFDWVRGKIGDYDEDNITANLEGLCAKNNFECRIHGIDDKTIDLTKTND